MIVKLTATYFITTDHAKSRFGQPILVNQATGQAFLPSDSLQAYESWQEMPATQIVNKMASWRDFSVEERKLIERFLGIQREPEAPGRKTRDESDTPRPLSFKWQSR